MSEISERAANYISPDRPKGKNFDNRRERAEELKQLKGHPLFTLDKENSVLVELVANAKQIIENKGDLSYVLESLRAIRPIGIHYDKKGDLLYPLMKSKYQVTGPSDVMWTDDDRIRYRLANLEKTLQKSGIGVQEANYDEFWAIISDIEKMLQKENNIVFPVCAAMFTEAEWRGIYRDAQAYPVCFGVEQEAWEQAEAMAQQDTELNNRELSPSEHQINLPGGHLTVGQLTALLNTMPYEITFVDAEDINCFFNEGPKVFKRAKMAINRSLYSCHPPKIEVAVRKIIEDFRNGKKDQVVMWNNKCGRIYLVTYMAVRTADGQYAGTVELVQDMEFAKEYFTRNFK